MQFSLYINLLTPLPPPPETLLTPRRAGCYIVREMTTASTYGYFGFYFYRGEQAGG